jgi:hypothetical protein
MGHDIDAAYLGVMYDTVESNSYQFSYDSSIGTDPNVTATRSARSSSVLGSLTTFVPRVVRPSAASTMMAGMRGDIDTAEYTDEDCDIYREKFTSDLNKALLDSSALLTSLSSYVYHFFQTGVDTNISLDLISFMYETVWFHFKGVSDSLLADGPNVDDMVVTFQTMDILCYSLVSEV